MTGLVLGAPSKPGRACPLTLKRALIDSKLPRIVSMDGTAPGTKSHGTGERTIVMVGILPIVCVDDDGWMGRCMGGEMQQG